MTRGILYIVISYGFGKNSIVSKESNLLESKICQIRCEYKAKGFGL